MHYSRSSKGKLAEALAANNIRMAQLSCARTVETCALWMMSAAFVTKNGIQAEQEGAQRKQHNKAKKMQVVSNLHLKKAEVGDIVMVSIPLVDRRRAEFPNVKAANVKAVELQVDKSGAQEFEMRRWIFKQEICSLLVSSISRQLTTWPRKERYAFVKQEMPRTRFYPVHLLHVL